MTKKIAVVTGANSGIGLEVSKELARRDYYVVMACRSPELGEAAAGAVRGECGLLECCEARRLDLASLISVRRFASEFQASFARLDVLVNNAGVMAGPFLRTRNGFEQQFGTNFLGHFLLTRLLLRSLRRSAPSRVVFVSSLAHLVAPPPALWLADADAVHDRRFYNPWLAYAQSKMALLLYSRRLALQERPNGVFVNAVHVGVARTALFRSERVGRPLALLARIFLPLLALSPARAAQAAVFAASAPEIESLDLHARYWRPLAAAGREHREIADSNAAAAAGERLETCAERWVAEGGFDAERRERETPPPTLPWRVYLHVLLMLRAAAIVLWNIGELISVKENAFR